MPLEAQAQEHAVVQSPQNQTQPNQQQQNQPPLNQTPFAIARLEEAARVIRQANNELPALRRRLERNMEFKARAREIYGDLQNQQRRLRGALNAAALALLEAEQDELASRSVKLSQSIKGFNLMTPDYSKLCAAVNGFLASLAIIDLVGSPILGGGDAATANFGADVHVGTHEGGYSDALTQSQATNNRIIGRLMNNVRMGYYPTCTENIEHIVRGIEPP